MAQTHTQSEQAQKARNGMTPKQQVKDEDRAAWEGMTDLPPQDTHTSKRRRLFEQLRQFVHFSLNSVRRVLKARGRNG